MQISRPFLVACATACATTIAVRGNDTPAQSKARDAMREQMQVSPAHPSTAPSAPPPPVVVPSSDAPIPPPAPPVQHADSESIAKARAAMRQKIQETPTALPPATAPQATGVAATAAPAPAPAPAPPPPVVVIPPPSTGTMSSQPSDSESIAKAREAVRYRTSQQGEVVPNADPESIARAREAVRQRIGTITYVDPSSRSGHASLSNFPPLEGPALPISYEKQQRLAELLGRYRADQVTPEQYQAERAKILAAP